MCVRVRFSVKQKIKKFLWKELCNCTASGSSATSVCFVSSLLLELGASISCTRARRDTSQPHWRLCTCHRFFFLFFFAFFVINFRSGGAQPFVHDDMMPGKIFTDCIITLVWSDGTQSHPMVFSYCEDFMNSLDCAMAGTWTRKTRNYVFLTLDRSDHRRGAHKKRRHQPGRAQIWHRSTFYSLRRASDEKTCLPLREARFCRHLLEVPRAERVYAPQPVHFVRQRVVVCKNGKYDFFIFLFFNACRLRIVHHRACTW